MHKFNLNDWRINMVILISEDQILLQRKLGRPSPPKYTTSAAACKRLLVSLFWRESSNSYYSSATEEKTCCRLRKKIYFTIWILTISLLIWRKAPKKSKLPILSFGTTNLNIDNFILDLNRPTGHSTTPHTHINKTVSRKVIKR